MSIVLSQEEILLSLLQGPEAQVWGSQRQGWKRDVDMPACAWDGIRCDVQTGDIIELDLPAIGIQGTLPTEIGTLTRLRSINMFQNKFIGTIPSQIYELPGLIAIDMGLNQLEGRLERFLSPHIKIIHFENNNLSGSIPKSMGKWYPQLTSLDLGHNRLTGTIPEDFFDYTKDLIRFSLRQNNFHGTIPTTIGELSKLQYLILNDNHFYGTIPRQLVSTQSKLAQVFLQHNAFSGTIPQDIDEIRTLADFFVDGNKLTGTVPISLCSRDMNAAHFSHIEGSFDRDGCESVACPINHFSHDGVWPCLPCPRGLYTPYLGFNGQECLQIYERDIINTLYRTTGGVSWYNATRWSNPNVPHCMFEGITCNEENKVVNITLNNMNLQGSIPSSLGRLAHLRVLDLKHNRLSGTVPSDLRFSPLEHLDVSNNSILGPLPPLLCEQEGINDNGRYGQFSCDVLACPSGSWYPTGKSLDSGRHCFPCQNSKFVGAVACSMEGIGSAESLGEYIDTHQWPHFAFIIMIVSTVLLALFAYTAKRRKRVQGEQNAKLPDEQFYRRSGDHMGYEENTPPYQEDYGIMNQEELTMMSASATGRRAASGTGPQQRRSREGSPPTAPRAGLPQHSSFSGAQMPGQQSSGMEGTSLSAPPSPEDDPDTQDLWLDVPKIA